MTHPDPFEGFENHALRPWTDLPPDDPAPTPRPPVTVDGLEQSRPIPHFPGYRATREGLVQSCHFRGPIRRSANGRLFGTTWRDKAVSRPKGARYATVELIDPEGRSHRMSLHRVVALAFLPNPDDLPVVRHLDGNTENNHVDNLAWGTYVQNEADKIRHGTRGKLSAAQRTQAFELRSQGWTQRAIGDALGVNPATISRLLGGSSWRGAA